MHKSFHKDQTITDLLKTSMEYFKLDDIPTNCVRLRNFDFYQNVIKEPITNENITLKELSEKCFFLEVKKPEEEWQMYNPDEIQMNIIQMNKTTKELELPVRVTFLKTGTLGELKQLLEKQFGIVASKQRLFKKTALLADEILSADDSMSIRDKKIALGSESSIYLEEAAETAGAASDILAKLKKGTMIPVSTTTTVSYRPKEKTLTIQKKSELHKE